MILNTNIFPRLSLSIPNSPEELPRLQSMDSPLRALLQPLAHTSAPVVLLHFPRMCVSLAHGPRSFADRASKKCPWPQAISVG